MAMAPLLHSRLFWIAVAVVAVAAVLPFWPSVYVLGVLTAGYYFGVFAMAWGLLFGFAGGVNFGPTVLIGAGADTPPILNNKFGLGVPRGVAAGGGGGRVCRLV